MNRDLRPVAPAVEREQLEWLAQISTRHERQLQELNNAEGETRREAEQLAWVAQVFPGCPAQQRNPLRSEFDADVREFADAITGRSTVEIDEAWDPAKHPRTAAPPNPGWWAPTGDAGGGGRPASSLGRTASYPASKHIAALQVSSVPKVGHHWVPVAVVFDEDIRRVLSDKAVEYAMGAYSGPTTDPHNYGKYGGVLHRDYSAKVKEELQAFIKRNKITKMTAEQMEEFGDLMKSGAKASGKPHPQIGAFNSAIKAQVAKGTAPPSTMDDILAAGRKYLKHPRFQILAAGAVISGVLGEVVAQQVKVLQVAAHSGHYERALRALTNGDLDRAQRLLIGDDQSLYVEIQDRVGFHAAEHFKIAMRRAFANATNRVYK
ncbi:MAG: hypothetical protein HYX69_02900 [Planctomycetia bacterium]|nr:hypothetical protein [Planctomycetia bacterium]